MPWIETAKGYQQLADEDKHFVWSLNMRRSCRAVACTTWVVLISGCFGGSENPSELYPVVNERGIITYRSQSSDLGSSDPVLSPTDSPPSLLELNTMGIQRQQQREQAYQEMMRKVREQASQQRQQDQDEQAYQDMRRSLVANQAWAERQRELVAQQRQSQWNQEVNQRIQSGMMQLEQASQEVDDQLQRMRDQQVEQQQRAMMLRHQRASNGSVVFDLNGALIVP